jgi:hypothetical protein
LAVHRRTSGGVNFAPSTELVCAGLMRYELATTALADASPSAVGVTLETLTDDDDKENVEP